MPERARFAAVLTIFLIAAAVIGVTAAAGNGAGSTLNRPDEPVVIQYTAPKPFADINAGAATGALNYQLPARLLGIQPKDLVAFRWDGAWTQIPVQVDEREVMDINRIYGPGYPSCSDPCYTKPPNQSATGGASHINYTDPNTWVGADTNPLLDANDEVAFLVDEAGGEVAGSEAPAGVDPASAVEVELTDPLDTDLKGYVYLFKNAADLTPAAGAPDIDYHFEIAGGKSYKDLTGSYKPTTTTAPSMARGPRPENSYVETPFYKRGFADRWKDNDLRIFRGLATGVDILDRHDAQFDTLDASCVRTQNTYAQGEGAFVTNKTGPVRAIRDFIGANSGPHVQREHIFYPSKEVIHTFLRVHPVPGVTDFFDYSAAAIGEAGVGLTYSNGLQTIGTVTSGVQIDGTQDPVPPFPGASGLDGWEAVNGPQGGLVMVQSFITNNADPSYHLNYRDQNFIGRSPCTGDAFLYGASGPQGTSAFENTDEAQRLTYGGGTFKNLYYKRSIFYEAPNQADGEARLDEEQNPVELAFADPGLSAPVPNAPPTARFTFSPPAPLTGQTIDLDGSTSTDPGGSISSYEWDFDGAGDFDDATGATAQASYGTPGTKTIRLRVTDDQGATDVFSQQLVVSDPPNQRPQASFTFLPASPATDEQVDLDGSGSDDPDGTVDTWEWDLDGNGSFTDPGDATGSTTSTSFSTSGAHVVTLRVTDDDGATDTQSRTIVVDGPPVNQPPDASFTAIPLVALTNETINLDAGGSGDSDGTVDLYEWDLDDDGEYDDATGSTTTTSYPTTGTKTIGLRVTDDDDATDVTSRQVSVQDPANPAPNAEFTYSPPAPEVGDTVNFDGSNSSDDGSIALYEWDLDGDGDYDDATGSNPDTVYNAPRTGLVGLKVTDDLGATDTATQQLTVIDANQAPLASFDAVPETPKTDETVTFGSTSTDGDGSVVSWEWDLDDDGDFDDGTSPLASTSYATPGFHNVSLRVTDNDGATAVAPRSINVEPVEVTPPEPEPRLCRGLPATVEAIAGRPARGTRGADVIVGTQGADVLLGRGGADVICGQAGNDRIFSGAGPDIVLGNKGNDRIFGQPGADVLRGNRGNDRIYGGPGRDSLNGGFGFDLLNGGSGRDNCAGGGGRTLFRSC